MTPGYRVANQKPEHYLKAELYERVRRDPELFEFLQSASLDGIWYWDIERPDQEWMSPRFWEVLGYEPATRPHLASAWQHVIHPDDLPVARANFERHCADPSHPYDQLVRYLHADGSTVWIRCRGLAMRDPAGRAIRMLGAHSDVTALKRAELAATRLAAELEIANKELEAFSYSVSHDLRAPLRAVDGFARLVEEDYSARLDDEGRRMLGVIRAQALRMGRLIDDLLAFSRVTRQAMEPSAIDMQALAREVFEALAALEPARTLRLELGALPAAHGSPALIRQVWENLLANAVKFTRDREAAVIEVGAHPDEGGGTTYYVKDNGAGFDMRYADKLFGVFQRLHSDTEFPGTGIGLSIVARIVHRHGGRVWAEAEVDRGATFSFTLGEPTS